MPTGPARRTRPTGATSYPQKILPPPPEPGNINLFSRPHVQNPDGSTSTVRSMSFSEGGPETLIPTVQREGQGILDPKAAIDQYHQTGEHLGQFQTPEEATAYAQRLHDAYAQGDYDVPLATSRTDLNTEQLLHGLKRLQQHGATSLPPEPPKPAPPKPLSIGRPERISDSRSMTTRLLDLVTGGEAAGEEWTLPGDGVGFSSPEIGRALTLLDQAFANKPGVSGGMPLTPGKGVIAGLSRLGKGTKAATTAARAAEAAEVAAADSRVAALRESIAPSPRTAPDLLIPGTKKSGPIKTPKRSPLDPTIPNPELSLTRVADRYPEIHAALGDEPNVVESFGEGIRRLGKGLMPESKEDYRLLPSMRARLAHMFETGKSSPLQADWSAFTEPRILQAFGGDEELARLYANIWGAASQGTNVAQNTQEATAAWHYLLKHGRLPDAREALMGGQHPTLAKIGLPTIKLPNMQRALEGEKLRGPKLKDMAAFHEGQQASPLDRHYIVGLGGDTETLDKQYALIRKLVEKNEGIRLVTDKVIDSPWGPVTGNEYAYRRMVQALQRELRALDPSQAHNPIFGRTWEGIRDWKQLDAFEGPGDIFERKGLLEPGAMVDMDPLEAALRGKGGPWQQKLLLSLFASVGPSLLFRPTSADASDAPAPGAQPTPGRGPRDWLPTP